MHAGGETGGGGARTLRIGCWRITWRSREIQRRSPRGQTTVAIDHGDETDPFSNSCGLRQLHSLI